MLSVFLISLNSVLIIITVILIGFLLRKSGIFSENFSNDISNLLVDVALPLSILLSTQRYVTKKNFWVLTKGTILIMIAILICFAISFALSSLLHVDKSKRSIFINGIVNTNTLFVGLPLNLALFGAKSLPYFLCYFMANTIATWGIGVKIIYRDGPKEMVKKANSAFKRFINLFTFPMWGFIIGLLFFFLGIKITGFLNESFSYVANLVTPLALIFLGLQLGSTKMSDIKIEPLDLLSQFGRYIISPLVMYLVIIAAQQLNIVTLQPLFFKTLIIQSATPMLTALPLLAEQAKLDVVFSTKILTESILVFPFAVIVIMLLL